MAGVASLLDVDSASVITKAAIVVFGVEVAPVRLAAAEQTLVGQKADVELFRQVAAHAQELDAMDDVHVTADYRRQVSATLVRRSLLAASERATGQK